MPKQLNLDTFLQGFQKKPLVSDIEFDKIQANTCMLKETLNQALSNSRHTVIFKVLSCFLIFEKYIFSV